MFQGLADIAEKIIAMEINVELVSPQNHLRTDHHFISSSHL